MSRTNERFKKVLEAEEDLRRALESSASSEHVLLAASHLHSEVVEWAFAESAGEENEADGVD